LTQKIKHAPRHNASSFAAPRQLRVDFLHFSGSEDILQWRYRAKQFFSHLEDSRRPEDGSCRSQLRR